MKKDFINEIYEKKIEISYYENCKIFNIIYLNESNKFEENNDEEILNNSIEKFTFYGINFFNNLTKIDKLERFLKSFEDKTSIIKELTNINKVLKLEISPKKIEKQGNKLFIIKNKEKILLYIKGIISIIEQFKLEKTDFYDSLIYLRNILNDDNFLENIDNIEKNITKFDVKLINDINNPIISFITLMFENDNFLPFIISKTEEDIKKIEELAGEIDNQKVTNSDIKKLIEIISFKEILKKFTNKNDEDFLKQFEKELENSNTLIVSLNDISKKFKDIEELFIKTMDISGYSKIIIHHIILSSEFKIENINNEYKCSIKYIYDEKQNTTKEKSLREILETKDKILLRQKRKNEEDESENKRNKTIFTNYR